MGKRGSWFSAIKRAFIPKSKEKLADGSEKKGKEKKKKGLIRKGDGSSFIPLFREPSSIEKILGEAERDQQQIIIRPVSPPTPSQQPNRPPPIQLPQPQSQPLPLKPSLQPQSLSQQLQPQLLPPRIASPKDPSPKVVVHHQKEASHSHRPPTLWNHDVAAIKIQAAYRGYMARRSFRALRGLVRLQGVIRSNNVKRQTTNAMKYMQLLVRVQSQIRLRRIQMLENQALQRQALYKNNKELESSLSKWSHLSEAGDHDDWDDSLLTKEEIEARMQKKVAAVMKRERAMAYAYSHQLWKSPKSAQTALMDIRSGGFPWWWNWLDQQLPSTNTPETQSMKGAHLTPARPNMEQHKQSPRPLHSFGFDNLGSLTPKSRSPLPPRMKLLAQTPSPFSRFSQTNSPSLSRYSKARASTTDSTFHTPLRDDDSLTSCPPFSVPNYMSPTLSAKAKVRPNSYGHRLPSPSGDQKRRLSFPLTPGGGSFKWSKGSFKESPSQKGLDKDHQSLQSGGNMSVDSTTSLPVGIGRKPFNRFV